MNKKKTIITVVLVVFVLAILGVVVFGNKIAKAPESSTVMAPTSTTPQATSTPASDTSSSSLSAILSTSTLKNYAGSSFSFNYPGSWSIFSAMPLMITSFNGHYKAGGVMPAAGAQIGVVTTTISGNLNAIMSMELAYATHLATSTITVDGTSCAKAVYQVAYAPGATAQNISIYCSRGNELWKIYFSYPANDPAEQSDISDLNGILGSMKLSG